MSAEGRVEHQNEPKRPPLSVAVWVRSGVQLDYSCRLKSVPSDRENRVGVVPIEILRYKLHFFKDRDKTSSFYLLLILSNNSTCDLIVSLIFM